MYISKQVNGFAVEVKKRGKRFYKGSFKTKKEAIAWGTSKEGKK
jgi:hypothetical protein